MHQERTFASRPKSDLSPSSDPWPRSSMHGPETRARPASVRYTMLQPRRSESGAILRRAARSGPSIPKQRGQRVKLLTDLTSQREEGKILVSRYPERTKGKHDH